MANPNTTQLAPPSVDDVVLGQHAIHEYVRVEASALAPVVWSNMKYVQSINIGEPTYDFETPLFHMGSKDKRVKKVGPTWQVTINVLNGKVGETLAALRGESWGSSNVGIPLNSSNDEPQVHLVTIFRKQDNTTHVFSRVIQDLILDDSPFDVSMQVSDSVINGHTYYPPFLVYTGYDVIYDVWDATPSTPTYTLSSTPGSLITASNYNQWDFDNAAHIKLKDNSDSQTMGNRMTTGVSISGVTMTWTANTPASGDKVYCLYVAAAA